MNLRRLIALALFAALAAALSAVPFQDGETLTFNVKYGVAAAGTTTMEARTSTYEGNPVWYLNMSAKTHSFFDPVYKVRDKIESWWDKKTLLPYKFSKNLQEGSYRQNRIHTFDQKGLTSHYQRWNFKNGIWKHEDLVLPFTTQDALSAIYNIRTKSLAPGSRIKMNVTSDGRSVVTDVIVQRREKVSTIFGMIDCLVVEPRLQSGTLFNQKGKFLIWLTDDAYKIPVRIESAITIGSFVAKLSDAKQVPYIIKYPNN